MDLVKRYIYAVTSRLPASQRDEIERELQSNIEDMLEERTGGGEASKQDVEAVLLALGSPETLADQYRGHRRYLIGPEYYASYLTVLKLVLVVVGIVVTVTFAIQWIMEPSGLLAQIGEVVGSLVMGGLQVFAWVTICFAFVETIKNGNREETTSQSWKPTELPPLPDARNKISRSGTMASILFTVFFAALLTFALEVLGVWIHPGSEAGVVVPFFNESVFRGFLPLIWLLALLSVLNDSAQWIGGKWSVPLIAADIAVTVLSFILALVLFTNPEIWNPDFMQQLVQNGLVQAGTEAFDTVRLVWERGTEGVIYLIGIICLLEIIMAIVRAFRLKRVNIL